MGPRNSKLSPYFYGPFEVVQKIGDVTYKLKFPDTSTIHPVFHVSLLKKKFPRKHDFFEDLSGYDSTGTTIVQLAHIL